LTEGLAVEEHRGHGHHLSSIDFVGEEPSIDGDVADVRVRDGHQVEGLHDIGTDLASQRKVGLEVIRPFERAHLIDDLGRGTRWVAADLKDREHE
jgi:hypothetical protein